MSHSAELEDHGRLKRIVRLMLAHAIDGTISSRDVNNVFDLVGIMRSEREAVLRALSETGTRISTDEPTAHPETGDASGETVLAGDPAHSAARSATHEDIETARRILRMDRGKRNPSKRVLTAREEIGLAILMRGSGISLGKELPHGYRAELNPEDERAQAFDTFMVHNIRLVWSIARTQQAGRLELEDIVQHGMLGLCRAVEKFDATQGYKFSTYATWWIRQSISRGIANEGRLIRIPVYVHEQVNKLLTIRNRILDESSSCALPKLASETGLPIEKVIEFLRLSAGVVSLDKPVTESGDSLGEFILSLPADDADPAQLIDRTTLQRLVREALTDLSKRDALVISLRGGLDNDKPLTLDEIGKILGLTRERIRQIESKARVALRVALIKRGLEPMRRVSTTPAGGKSNDDL